MDGAEIAKLIEDLETRVERLRALYEQYFVGIERIEPMVLRKDVDRRLWMLRREQVRNTALRFKLETVVQRYNSYQQYWRRIVREIENGTYQRDLSRAARRFGEAVTAFGRRRQKMIEKGMAKRAEREARRAAGGQSSIPAPFDSLAPPMPFDSQAPSAEVSVVRATTSHDTPSSAVPSSPPEEGWDIPVEPDWGFDDVEQASPVAPIGAAARPAARPGSLSLYPPAAAAASPKPATLPGGVARPAALRAAPLPAARSPESPPARPVLPGRVAPSPPAKPGAVPPVAKTAIAPPTEKAGAIPPVAKAAVGPPSLSLKPPAIVPRPASLVPRPVSAPPRPATVSVPPAPVTRRADLAAIGRSSRTEAVPAPAAAQAQTSARTTRIEATPRVGAVTAPAQPGPPPPRAPVRNPGNEQPVASGAAAGGAASGADQELSAARVRQLYGQYVEAKRRANESTASLTFDKVAANLRKTATELRAKHAGQSIDFEVVMRNGKPALKPVLKG